MTASGRHQPPDEGKAPPPRYAATPPSPLQWRDLFRAAPRYLRRFRYLAILPFRPFAENPTPSAPLPEPAASITAVHRDLAAHLESRAETRGRGVEAKADRTLSLLLFLIPLVLSAFVYAVKSGAARSPVVIVLFVLTVLSLLSGVLSATRASGIYNRQQLSVKTIYDTEGDTWKDTADHHYVRGVIWCAAWNEAMNDHIADFVRAARLHVLVALMMATAGAGVLISTANDAQEAGRARDRSVEQLASRLDSLSAVIAGLDSSRTIDAGRFGGAVRIGGLRPAADSLRVRGWGGVTTPGDTGGSAARDSASITR